MTDEELSELAEVLEDACQGKYVSASTPSWQGAYCPLGALLGGMKPGWYVTKLPYAIYYGFVDGFDGNNKAVESDHRAYELGKLFREKYP